MLDLEFCTDAYEFTMLKCCLADGSAGLPAVFEVFARQLPDNRRYGVVAGVGRFLDVLKDFSYSGAGLDFLLKNGLIDEVTKNYLENFKFEGTVYGYREGELYFPGSPVLSVHASLGQCLVLETLILSMYNFDSAVASAAAHMEDVSEGRTLLDMGSRRVNEHAAVAAARAAYIGGFDATSNVNAGIAYGVPVRGTAAHAFTLAHSSEKKAFESQIKTLGNETTLLVDTYDTMQGVETAIEVSDKNLGGIRIDSGDLKKLAFETRELLDSRGCKETKIVVTSDLGVKEIKQLANAPVDVYGVGTKLVGGDGAPSAGFVYKLVAIENENGHGWRNVAKKSANKISVGGVKVAYRSLNSNGVAEAEHIVQRNTTNTGEHFLGRPLQVQLVTEGKVNEKYVDEQAVTTARQHCFNAKKELPEKLFNNTQAIRVI